MLHSLKFRVNNLVPTTRGKRSLKVLSFRPESIPQLPSESESLATVLESDEGFVMKKKDSVHLKLRTSVRVGNNYVTETLTGVSAAASRPKGPALPYMPHLPTNAFEELRLSWHGANIKPLILSVAIGLVVNYIMPRPEVLTAQAWAGFAIFLSAIAGLVLGPLPVGAWAFSAMTFGIVTHVFPFHAVMGAITSEVIWVIALSALLARSFETSGLGARVANLFVRAFGKAALSLSIGLALGELAVSAAIPAIAARAGGIFMPVIRNLALSESSHPGQPSRFRLGSFLCAAQLTSENHSSAFFMTGAANNLLCLSLAAVAGVSIGPNPYVTWLVAASVPALVGTILSPIAVYKLFPPEVKEMPGAPKKAAERLTLMGPLSRMESITLGVIGLCVGCWAFGAQLGMSTVATAMLGVTLLLNTGALTWKECLQNNMAWDTLVWYSAALGMANCLVSSGVIHYFSSLIGAGIAGLNMAWPQVLLLCNGLYYVLHYLTASQAAHAGAFYLAFLSISIAAGAPPVLAALTLAFNTDVIGAETHYASAQAPVYLSTGFLTVDEIISIGAKTAVLNAFVWVVVGGAWWKVIGLW